MSLKSKVVNLVEESDWSALVREVYGRPYCLQQQDGCMANGTTIPLVVPYVDEALQDLEDNLPEDQPTWWLSEDCGVKFSAWLAKPVEEGNTFWWERNFYPMLESVANDLHSRGLLPAGEYLIRISW